MMLARLRAAWAAFRAPLGAPVSPDYEAVIAFSRAGGAAELAGHYRVVFDNRSGRKVLAHLLLAGGVFATDQSGKTAIDLAAAAARRETILEIYRLSGGEPVDLAEDLLNSGESNE